MIDITVMLKGEGFRTVKIKPELIGKLAKSIKDNGFEWVSLVSGPIAVVGFFVTGKETGERVIMIGSKEPGMDLTP